MKNLLLLCLLLPGASAYAQTESAQPFKGATVIIVHTSDSASTSYKRAAQSLLAAGYMLDKADKELGFANTRPKAIGSAYGLALQAATVAAPNGSAIAFSGQFTWSSAATIMANTDKREIPVTYTRSGSSPAAKMWAEMLRVATTAYPSGIFTYR